MIIKLISKLDFVQIIFGLCIIIIATCTKIEREPKVETGIVSDITTTSASASGNVIDLGDDGIIDYGHCWSTITNPSINNFKTSLGTISKTGSYTSLLQSLSSGTKYYIKAYAKNANDEVYYGGESSFITHAISLPTITTTPVTSITSTTAISGGNISTDGGSSIISRGVCWSASQNPTISDSHTSNGTDIGTFSCNLTGLIANTTYFVRAYATNNIGTAYGNNIVFTTYGVMDTEGNGYKTVVIGTQVWMAENLKTTKYRDGTIIPNEIDNNSWSNLTTPAYCWFNNEITNRSIYGGLYNWHSVNTNKLCPQGWHVPTDDEWSTLTNYLGGESVAGGKLKAIGTVEDGTGLWHSPNTGATNETGFTSIPGGGRDSNGIFFGINSYSYWWSCTETLPEQARVVGMGYNYLGLYRFSNLKRSGFYIRCIRD